MIPHQPSLTRPGLLLHLSAPMQSWGQRSRFGERDTATVPTRSGLIGLIAAADGRPRDADLDDLRALRFLIRIDRPGSLLRDFHTVGGGRPNRQTVITAEGKRRPGDTATLVTTRYYLQDAAFTIAITTAADTGNTIDEELLSTVATALAEPTWPLFLGRRACPPDATLLLGHHDDAWAALMKLPLHRERGWRDSAVDITYSADQPLHDLPLPDGCTPVGEETTGSITDDPLSFAETGRAHTRRTSYQRVINTPQAVTASAGIGTDYLTALTRHLHPEAATGASR